MTGGAVAGGTGATGAVTGATVATGRVVTTAGSTVVATAGSTVVTVLPASIVLLVSLLHAERPMAAMRAVVMVMRRMFIGFLLGWALR